MLVIKVIASTRRKLQGALLLSFLDFSSLLPSINPVCVVRELLVPALQFLLTSISLTQLLEAVLALTSNQWNGFVSANHFITVSPGVICVAFPEKIRHTGLEFW